MGLELKSKNGVVSGLQKFNLDWIRCTGGVGLVAYPSNWDDVKKIILDLDGSSGNTSSTFQ